MKRILIVAATYNEVKFLEKFGLRHSNENSNICQIIINDKNIDVLISGVGMVATTLYLTKQLSQKDYDLIINIGIAGAFENTLNLGEVVQIATDFFADLGADDAEQFVSVFSLGLIAENEFPFSSGLLKNNFEVACLNCYKKVNGITVNKVSGNEVAIQKLKTQLFECNYKPETESMEGAAFFYTCFQFKTPCIQLRAISNYIEKRNKANWKIMEAMSNLEIATILVLTELQN